MIKRLIMMGDALSQLANVTFLPNIHDTTANESISGRAYRSGWKRTQAVIDFIFLPIETQHCKKAHYADVQRAKELLGIGEKK